VPGDRIAEAGKVAVMAKLPTGNLVISVLAEDAKVKTHIPGKNVMSPKLIWIKPALASLIRNCRRCNDGR